jgi:hypothetical protein
LFQDEVIAEEKTAKLSNLTWNLPGNRYVPEMETDPEKTRDSLKNSVNHPVLFGI